MCKRLVLYLSLFVTASSCWAAIGGPDGYGYTFKDQAEVDGPQYQWIDISTSGQAVVLSGVNSASTSVGPDGIGSPVALDHPFTIYGVTYTQLVPAANGYISGDPTATGVDSSPDCPFPATPGSDPGGLRLNPFHGSLNLTNAQSQVMYKYFDISPHPHSSLGVSVFSWVQAFEAVQEAFYDFQVLLFDNGDVLFQYQTSCFTKFATVGIQDDTAPAPFGLDYACNTTPGITIPANTAVLFEPPIIDVTTGEDQLDTPAGLEVSLREAVRDIPVGGKIHLLVGSDVIDVEEVNGSIEITNALSIDGQFNVGDVKPVISGEEISDTILAIKNCTVTLRDFVMRDANATNFAFTSRRGSAIEYRRISASNSVTYLKLCEVDFIENHGGSAMYIINVDQAMMYRCRFRENSNPRTDGGGAIQAFTADGKKRMHVHISSCEFAFNKAQSDFLNESDRSGGAVVGRRVDIIVERSSLFNNFATDTGGGIYLYDSNLKLSDSTLSFNGATFQGAAIYSYNTAGNVSTNQLYRNTFVENHSAPSENFGINISNQGSPDSILQLGGNVFKQTGMIYSPTISEGYNLSDRNETELDQGSDIVSTDPNLGPLGAYGGFSLTHLPLRGSPLIDAGNPASSGVDQRGFVRPLDGDGDGSATNDIGAVEAGVPIEVTTASDENNGVGVGGVSLREAIDAALPGQHVVFAPGFSGFTITPTLTNYTLNSGKHVHIDASDLSEPVTIDAGSIEGVHLFALDGILSIHGVEMRNGYGAVFMDDNAAFTGDRCLFQAFGQGLYLSCLNCSPSILGGKLASTNLQDVLGPLVLDKCVLRENDGAFGGGANIHNSSYNNRITSCWFHRNTAKHGGGGLHIRGGGTYIASSTFSENEAIEGPGGGIRTFLPELVAVRGVTLSGNRAGGYGGGMYIYDNTTLSFSTIVGNQAGVNGAGIAVSKLFGGVLHHNIFQKNMRSAWGTTDNIYGSFPQSVFSLGYNLTDTDESEFNSTNDVTLADALLTPLAWHAGAIMPSHYPLQDSPSIDAGADVSFLPEFEDMLGLPRIADGDSDGTNRVDIGAVEAAEPIWVTSLADELTPGTNTLRKALSHVSDGGRILFDEDAMGGNTIVLSNALGQLEVTNSVVIDATGVKDSDGVLWGITIVGTGSNRIMEHTTEGKDTSIHGISFTGGNEALGGGIWVDDSRFTLTQSAMYGNVGTLGGALYASGLSDVLLENVTLHSNSVNGTGGAIFGNGSDLKIRLRHCTVVGNLSSSVADGLGSWNGCEMDVYSSIVADNGTENGVTNSTGVITSSGFNLTDDGFLSHSNDIVQNPVPLFPYLEDWGGLSKVIAPDIGCASVDQGPWFFRGPPCRDGRGFERVYGPRIDIGAFEMGARNNLGDPGLDGDVDGLDASWEQFYGTFSPLENPDNDSFVNLDEYNNETHPLYETLELSILSFDEGPGSNEVTFIWPSQPYAVYSIVYNKEVDGSWNDQIIPFIGAATSTTTAAISTPYGTNDPTAFFRIDQH